MNLTRDTDRSGKASEHEQLPGGLKLLPIGKSEWYGIYVFQPPDSPRVINTIVKADVVASTYWKARRALFN